MGLRAERERQKRRKYIKLMEEKRAREEEEIATMAMLLDASWLPNRKLFVKMKRDTDMSLNTSYRYFNRQGHEVYPSTVREQKA